MNKISGGGGGGFRGRGGAGGGGGKFYILNLHELNQIFITESECQTNFSLFFFSYRSRRRR